MQYLSLGNCSWRRHLMHSWYSKNIPDIFVVRHALTCAPEGCRLASPSLLPATVT